MWARLQAGCRCLNDDGLCALRVALATTTAHSPGDAALGRAVSSGATRG
jgi:hypothetical protein